MSYPTSEQIISLLSSKLKKGEKLYTPFYGVIPCIPDFSPSVVSAAQNAVKYCLFGRTDSVLIIICLCPFGLVLGPEEGFTRIPLANITKFKAKYNPLLRRHVIRLALKEGNCSIKLCVPQKAPKEAAVPDQAQNILRFIKDMQEIICSS